MVKARELPPRETVCALLDYSPETGIFRHKRTAGSAKVGDIAGCARNNGYIRIQIDGRTYLAHRLAALIMTGQCIGIIDHKNRKRDDNRWDNLRIGNMSLNHANTEKRPNNTSGHKGVFWHKKHQKWCATVQYKRKRLWLGLFEDIDRAVNAYEKAAEKLFGDFASHVTEKLTEVK